MRVFSLCRARLIICTPLRSTQEYSLPYSRFCPLHRPSSLLSTPPFSPLVQLAVLACTGRSSLVCLFIHSFIHYSVIRPPLSIPPFSIPSSLHLSVTGTHILFCAVLPLRLSSALLYSIPSAARSVRPSSTVQTNTISRLAPSQPKLTSFAPVIPPQVPPCLSRSHKRNATPGGRDPEKQK